MEGGLRPGGRQLRMFYDEQKLEMFHVSYQLWAFYRYLLEIKGILYLLKMNAVLCLLEIEQLIDHPK